MSTNINRSYLSTVLTDTCADTQINPSELAPFERLYALTKIITPIVAKISPGMGRNISLSDLTTSVLSELPTEFDISDLEQLDIAIVTFVSLRIINSPELNDPLSFLGKRKR